MAYSWDNRVKFVVRYMYDIDNNGYLDKNDFECLAVRTTIIESKGDFTQAKYEENRKVMRNLWNEIADLADFNKDGEVSVDEFKLAVKDACVGKPFDSFPGALKAFISSHFSTVDVNGDGLVGIEEYRVDCCSRQAYSEIQLLDDAYNKLCSAEDKKKGGIDIKRFQELYAQFIGNPDETIGAVFLFGPLTELS
ncbi:sarcoplasmic calcium-binding protein 1-like isoform X1 [Pollicipes pollicipes]|uniref:sarcoplasmic calcium-binding protein 1-like isoform X1 n=1 Tax=Pollicipes pollicipes TaxID=41117 RepID=UPI001884BA7A|nr:sarcoplasmic calcium-binding protein 1-like isoform X1 [Pollicipes pollicipes]XP_037082896.1 sarcoplasmic calcium-binding protein 1-like isoform X1 [Pollicipes pollicipes]